MKLFPLVVVGLAVMVPANQDRPAPHEATQLGMHEAADAEFRAANAEMTKALESLVQKAAGKPDAVAKLNKSQAAWKVYRDAQVGAMWPLPERSSYGSVYSMCVLTEMTNLTKARTSELRAMLEPTEGDVCGSRWPD